ncbi:hypothetical protein K4M64_004535 [Salmonella enterica]|nr:hypothetical protein [Salmonella enterica]
MNLALFNREFIRDNIAAHMCDLIPHAVTLFNVTAHEINPLIDSIEVNPGVRANDATYYVCQFNDRNGLGLVIIRNDYANLSADGAIQTVDEQCTALAYAGLFGALASDMINNGDNQQ